MPVSSVIVLTKLFFFHILDGQDGTGGAAGPGGVAGAPGAAGAGYLEYLEQREDKLLEVFFQIKNSNNLFQFIISHLKKMSICFIWLRAMLGDDNFTGGSVNLMFSLYMFYDLFQPCNTN
jgi:hypothetical protein